MKKIVLISVVFMLIIGVSCSKSGGGSEPAVDEKVVLDSEAKKASYAIGFNMAINLKTVSSELDLSTLIKGIRDAFKGSEPLMSQQQIQQTMAAFQQNVQKNQMARMQQMGEANKEAAEKFFAENAKKEGVKATKSGLQYQVITPAKGPKPKASDTIKVHYIGTFLDGKEFDSSFRRGQPAQFSLEGVIAGWTEGIQLMSVGAKYRFFIPSDLAYGPNGRQGIPPSAALIFDVELLEIVKPEAKK